MGMVGQRFILTTLALAALIWLATACGSGSSTPGTVTGGQIAVQAPKPAEQYPQVFAVKMQPQAVVEPGFKTTSLVSPSALNLGLPAPRSVSAASDEITIAAGNFDTGIGHLNVEARGEFALFQPQREGEEFYFLAEAAYCAYNIDLNGYTGIPTVSIVWTDEAYPLVQHEFWYALANYDTNSWDFYEGPLDQVVTLESFDQYTSDDGRLVVMPIMFDTHRVNLLEAVKLGVAETRATGLIPGEATFESDIPEYYVSDVPDSIDLAPECAPIGDQGHWSSCTAFAIANGCYNHELNTIYGPMGWDLTDACFQASPKYIYVETGKESGYSTPYRGRQLYKVAEGLGTFGDATEFNAPYDLDYNDNWTAEALVDADVLKTESYEPISYLTDTVKHFLANRGQTVFIGMNLDSAFFEYEPGTVWDYAGPIAGSHAMLIVGYDDALGAYKVRNSWGSEWGDAGYCWVSYGSLQAGQARAGILLESYSEAVAQRFLDPADLLRPPVNVTASQGVSPTGVQLKWESLQNAEYFAIYRDTRSAPRAVTSNTRWTDSNVPDDLAHTYWVRAVYPEGLSPFSTPAAGYTYRGVPEVLNVSPYWCDAGQVLTFTPTIRGCEPITYSWDFGGAGSQANSTEPAPTLSAGEPGEYEVRLEITNPFGSDVYVHPFTLLEDRDGPYSIFTIEPEIVHSGEAVLFDGSESFDHGGEIVLFEWDFDNDGVYDLASTEPTTIHAYDVYNMDIWPALKVTDRSGLISVTHQHVFVLDHHTAPVVGFTMDSDNETWQPPTTITFDASETFDYDDDITMYEWDLDGDSVFEEFGTDMVVVEKEFLENTSWDVTLRVTDAENLRSSIAHPLRVGFNSPVTGWEIHAVAPLRPADVAVIGGLPAVVAYDADHQLYYTYCAALPSHYTDWTVEPLRAGMAAYSPSLVGDTSGNPNIAYYLGKSLYFTSRDTGGEWNHMEVFSQGNDWAGQVNSIAIVGGKPAIAFSLDCATPYTEDGLYYARATEAIVTDPGQWDVTKAFSEFMLISPTSLCEVGGLPAVAMSCGISFTSRVWYACADTTEPTGVGSWTVHDIELVNDDRTVCSLVDLGGRPLVGSALDDHPYGNPYALRLAWADVSQPQETTDWNFMASAETELPLSCDLAVISGVPWAAFQTRYSSDDPAEIYLVEAITSEPAGDSDWTTTELFSGNYAGLHLIEITGQPAIVFYDNSDGWLYYATPTP